MADEVKHNNSIRPGEILPAIQELDTQINAEIAQAEESDTDKRTKTSPKNGEKGGRPQFPTGEWAKKFVARYFMDNSGHITLRYYKKQWYKYADGQYTKYSEDNIRAKIQDAMLNSDFFEHKRIAQGLVSDIIGNLKANVLCFIDDAEHPTIPFFISTGQSAQGLMPVKNIVIDLKAIVDHVNDGGDISIENACYYHDWQKEKTPDLFIPYGLSYPFDARKDCPKFRQYLAGVQPNPDHQKLLQMMAGLCLVPDCSYNVAFFLYGEAGTGKSVFIDVLEGLIGKENCCCVPLASFAARFGKAPLTEKLVNLVGEMPTMPETGNISEIEGMFKAITSGDIIPVERKGIDVCEARAIARLVFATNHLPPFSDRSGGVWDRLRIIPFNERFRGTDKQNPHLKEELREELTGILNWAIEGLAMLKDYRIFPECEEGKRIREELRASSDHEKEFLEEHTEESTGGIISTAELFKDYQGWMQDNGYRPVGAGKFQLAVKRFYPHSFIERQRDYSGHRFAVYNNIRRKT